MSKINTYNYEAYLLDYHEGTLSAVDLDSLKLFAKAHPELELDFERLDFYTLSDEKLDYPGKQELFKSEMSMPEIPEIEWMIIAEMEGDLPEEERANLDGILAKDKQAALIADLYRKTRLVEDKEVTFADKEILKRKTRKMPVYLIGALSTAAALILGWFLLTPLLNKSSESGLVESAKRNIIYLDKLAHPARYDQIASTVPDRRLAENPNEPLVLAEREEVFLAEIISRGISSVEPSEPLDLYADLLITRPSPFDSAEDLESISDFASNVIRERLLGQEREMVKKTRFTLWELADAGLQKLTDKFGINANIDRAYNNEGELVAVSFDSRLIGFEAPIKQRIRAQAD